MRDALVFNGSSLDFQEIRSHVIRIPEVVSRIREAQSIWDRHSKLPIDLATFIGSEDSVFMGHIRLKSLASAVVQLALLERFLRFQKMPQFLLGSSNGDSALRVAVNELCFEELVVASCTMSQVSTRWLKPEDSTQNGLALPKLMGIQLVEYSAFENKVSEFEKLQSEVREFERLVVDVVERQDVNRLIVIGPGHSLLGRRVSELTSREVQVIDSLELDPMLSWFWSSINGKRVALAN